MNLRKKGGGTDPLWPVPWSLKLGETRMTMGYGLHQNSAVEVDGRKVDLSERNDFEGFNIIVRAPVEDPAVQASVDIGAWLRIPWLLVKLTEPRSSDSDQVLYTTRGAYRAGGLGFRDLVLGNGA